jgi:hypothetical protein
MFQCFISKEIYKKLFIFHAIYFNYKNKIKIINNEIWVIEILPLPIKRQDTGPDYNKDGVARFKSSLQINI